jgi:hypothetical protein
MAVNLFTFVELYSKGLGALDHLLGKDVERARALGASDAEMLDWRLIDDMNPLSFQARTVINFAKQWPARVAGVEVPADLPTDLGLDGVRAAIAEARAYLAGLKPEQFAGRDDLPLTVSLGQMETTLPAGQWMSNFGATNFYFHLSTAYGILRMKGAQIGKRDLFAGGL